MAIDADRGWNLSLKKQEQFMMCVLLRLCSKAHECHWSRSQLCLSYALHPARSWLVHEPKQQSGMLDATVEATAIIRNCNGRFDRSVLLDCHMQNGLISRPCLLQNLLMALLQRGQGQLVTHQPISENWLDDLH